MPGEPVIISKLLEAQRYPHTVTEIQLLETHISWVILTGPYAYKFKKPLDLGFLDFSTLEKRRHCCYEELRLNRRLAPQLYLEVVGITGTPEDPYVGGEGEVLEYAVKMQQFPQSAMLEAVLARNELTTAHLDALARHIATFHASIARSDPSQPFGDADHVFAPMLENFEQINPLLASPEDSRLLDQLADWTRQAMVRLRPVITTRKRDGYVRECHGDMHLGNMVLLDDQITLFDCIEFNPNLYWIDVISEVAFLVMDLQQRRQRRWAWRFLNRYLEQTGDYQAVRVLRYYLVYRALVRAKVDCIRSGQPGLGENEVKRLHGEFRRYLAQAVAYTQPQTPVLLITHGLSGSGKTTYTQDLLESLGALRIRSDIERKRLFGLAPEQDSRSGIDSGIYQPEASARTYQHLAALAETMLQAGYPVIVDATFLERSRRDAFQALAVRLQLPFLILHFKAAAATLRKRVEQRQHQATDASEADRQVLERQLAHYAPLGEDERPYVLTIDTEQPPVLSSLIHAIQMQARKLPGQPVALKSS